MSDAPVELLIEEAAWDDALPELDEISRTATRSALQASGLDARDYAVSLLACDDTRIRALNADFRGKDQPTNVLSWPAFPLSPPTASAPLPAVPKAGPDGPVPLGDVAIALQTCQREADSASKPLKNHVTHLILHGVLHLLGYDHETPEDAALMEGIERKALGELGIPDPYE